jgi:peroxiredoxin
MRQLILVLGMFSALTTALAALAEKPAAEIGEMALPFNGVDVEGKQHSFDPKMLKKPALLVFWSSLCRHCVREMPALKTLYVDRGKDVELLTVGLDNDLEGLSQFVSKQELPFPVLTDLDDHLSKLYHVEQWPTLILIDKTGKIRDMRHRLTVLMPLLNELISSATSKKVTRLAKHM